MNHIKLFKMNKLWLTLLLGGFVFVSSVHCQSLSNVLNMKSVSIKKNGQNVDNENSTGSMLVAFNKTPIKIYEDNDLSCWVEYKYKQCGRKVKLSGKTFVELKNGDRISGKIIEEKQKIDDKDPGYFIGHYYDEISYDGNDKKVIINFDYNYRYKGYALASKYNDH